MRASRSPAGSSTGRSPRAVPSLLPGDGTHGRAVETAEAQRQKGEAVDLRRARAARGRSGSRPAVRRGPAASRERESCPAPRSRGSSRRCRRRLRQRRPGRARPRPSSSGCRRQRSSRKWRSQPVNSTAAPPVGSRARPGSTIPQVIGWSSARPGRATTTPATTKRSTG